LVAIYGCQFFLESVSFPFRIFIYQFPQLPSWMTAFIALCNWPAFALPGYQALGQQEVANIRPAFTSLIHFQISVFQQRSGTFRSRVLQNSTYSIAQINGVFIRNGTVIPSFNASMVAPASFALARMEVKWSWLQHSSLK
jgi:hypothetical protein